MYAVQMGPFVKMEAPVTTVQPPLIDLYVLVLKAMEENTVNLVRQQVLLV